MNESVPPEYFVKVMFSPYTRAIRLLHQVRGLAVWASVPRGRTSIMFTLVLRCCRAIAAIAAFLHACAGHAAEPTFVPSADLLAEAKKEGKVVLYTANFLDTEQAVAKRFAERFAGIQTEIVRAPTGQLITRIKTEAAANRLIADVIDISDRVQARAMVELFAAYAPPNAGDYPEVARTGDRLWPRSGNAWTITYNSELVQDPPKSWADLVKPEFGKLRLGQTVIQSGGAPFNRAMFERKVMGEDYWAKQAAFKPALFPSQAPMVDAMIRGEIGIAPLVTVLAIPLAAQGAPIKWFFAPEGVPVTVFCAGIAKGAGNPNAAKLFMDWALSREGQALMVELGSFSSLANAPMPPGVDAAAIRPWYPEDAEIERIFKSWTDDWNKAYNYRQ
jgi:iron(III) transport system substrate-binding protein